MFEEGCVFARAVKGGADNIDTPAKKPIKRFILCLISLRQSYEVSCRVRAKASLRSRSTMTTIHPKKMSPVLSIRTSTCDDDF